MVTDAVCWLEVPPAGGTKVQFGRLKGREFITLLGRVCK
jgi:hypothetical protein